MLAAGVFVATALNLSEAAATSLVRVPSVNSIALILIEKFHRFEDEMLIALSLIMAAAAAPAVWLAARAARSWR
jgi:ABC-type spermidine/putrescine transport system permease subunit II